MLDTNTVTLIINNSLVVEGQLTPDGDLFALVGGVEVVDVELDVWCLEIEGGVGGVLGLSARFGMVGGWVTL